MRPEDFLSGKFKDLKFRISYPDELVTTQKEVDQFAIEFGEWCRAIIDRVGVLEYKRKWINLSTKELLEIFKKEKELLNQSL